MLIDPDFVMHRPAPSMIPGVDFRLFGLTPHANTLGPVALIGLMLELHSPSATRAMRLAHLLAAASVFVLAQSKTAWVAALLIVVFVALPVGFMPHRDPTKRLGHFARVVFTVLACIGLLIGVSVSMAAFDVFGFVEKNVQIHTLTGRSEIWNITLQAWQENPMFGYGRQVWGAQRMLEFRLFHVGQAHNQVVQTLGEAGLMGLFLLLIYLLTLAHASIRQFASSRGITLGLLIVILSRCVTEAPLRLDSTLSWPTFTLVLLLVLVCHFARADSAVSKGKA
jgi:O-antigen ligase